MQNKQPTEKYVFHDILNEGIDYRAKPGFFKLKKKEEFRESVEAPCKLAGYGYSCFPDLCQCDACPQGRRVD